jgi:hypothetical protein
LHIYPVLLANYLILMLMLFLINENLNKSFEIYLKNNINRNKSSMTSKDSARNESSSEMELENLDQLNEGKINNKLHKVSSN